MPEDDADEGRPGPGPPGPGPPGRPGPSLTDLPDDLLRLVLAACTPRTLACLASTCRSLRRLEAAHEGPLGKVTLTASQRTGVLGWVRRRAPRVRQLVARRVLWGAEPWLAELGGLRSLALSCCRMSTDVLANLPTGLTSLDVHTLCLEPEQAGHLVSFTQLSFRRLRNLRDLRVVFRPSTRFAIVDVRDLPRGLRRLAVRGAHDVRLGPGRLPPGLRDFSVDAHYVSAPPLPCTVRRAEIVASRQVMDATGLSARPGRLECLALRAHRIVGLRMEGMTRLSSLLLQASTLDLDVVCDAELTGLECVDIRAADAVYFSSNLDALLDVPYLSVEVGGVAVDLALEGRAVDLEFEGREFQAFYGPGGPPPDDPALVPDDLALGS